MGLKEFRFMGFLEKDVVGACAGIMDHAGEITNLECVWNAGWARNN